MALIVIGLVTLVIGAGLYRARHGALAGARHARIRRGKDTPMGEAGDYLTAVVIPVMLMLVGGVLLAVGLIIGLIRVS